MVSINLIKKLRNITSLGIAECKDALVKSKGDIDLAIEDLYNKGTIKYTKSNAKKLGLQSKVSLEMQIEDSLNFYYNNIYDKKNSSI